MPRLKFSRSRALSDRLSRGVRMKTKSSFSLIDIAWWPGKSDSLVICCFCRKQEVNSRTRDDPECLLFLQRTCANLRMQSARLCHFDTLAAFAGLPKSSKPFPQPLRHSREERGLRQALSTNSSNINSKPPVNYNTSSGGFVNHHLTYCRAQHRLQWTPKSGISYR